MIGPTRRAVTAAPLLARVRVRIRARVGIRVTARARVRAGARVRARDRVSSECGSCRRGGGRLLRLQG